MALTSNNTGTCSKCGAAVPVTVYSSINVSEDPSLKDKVRSGELFTWTCPECGTVNLSKYETLYHDPASRLMIWCTENEELLKEKVGKLFEPGGELSDYTARFVRDTGSLMEKIKIFDSGLDDVALEICKYVTRQELGKDVSLKFFRMDGADNEITLTYPLKGEMEMVGIGFNVYEDALGILQRNPSLKEKATGIVRIDAEWLSKYIG